MALGGETCQRLGYGGGTLKCSRSCGWDASECTRCAPTDDIVRSCINAPLDATVPTAIAMDANDQEIALAWTSLDATGTLGLHFARFAPDLTLISERGLLGPSCPGEIALAARPGGWSLAVNSPGSLRLLALDATGATTSDILVASLSPLSAANSRTVLVHRDGEGPLLAWADAARAPSPFYGVVTRVSSDGASVGMPQDLAFEHPIVELTAAPTLAGWLVSAEQLIGGSEPNQIESFEIGPDGSPLPDAPIAGGWYSGKPRLAAEGTDLRRSCSSLGARNQPPAGIHFGKVVHQGVVTGPLVFVGPAGHYDYAAPMVIINGTTSLFTAYSESTYPRSLQYMQYDAQGTLLVGPRIIATDIDAIKTYVTARRGPDAVVAWINGQPPMLGAPGIGPSSIGMARVTPPQADAGRP
jgi:hypothetical protein